MVMGGRRMGIRVGARVYARRISFGHVEAMRWIQASSMYVPWAGVRRLQSVARIGGE
jgi:hypothetical protein